MKRHLLYLVVAFTLLSNINARAQGPIISYSPSSYVLTKNLAIAPITPTNSGGAVPATTYSAVTTLVAKNTGLNNPKGLTSDGAGNLYEADFSGNVIYKIDASTGVKSIIAGTGSGGESDNTTGTSAAFQSPWGIVYASGFLYVTDYAGSTVRQISTVAPYAVTTFAGLAGNRAEADGPGGLAAFNKPQGITYDGSTYLYVCDNGSATNGNTIRRIAIATKSVVTIAGANAAASELDNATGTSARFNGPAGITYDGAANLYVSDNGGNTIRKISTTAPYAVTTLVSSASGLSGPQGITMAVGDLYVADAGNNLIRKVTVAGVMTTFAGDGTLNDVDGTGTAAEFYNPYATATDNAGNLYVGDDRAASSTCRKISLTGYTITPPLASGLSFDSTTGIISGTPIATFPVTNYTVTAYNASGSNSTVVTLSCTAATLAPNINYSPSVYVLTKNMATAPITPTNSGGAVPATVYGTVTTLVANHGGLNNPRGLVSDGAGNLYETDFAGEAIYRISAAGALTKIAGTGSAGESDNTTGTLATFNSPSGIAYDVSGFLYVTDYAGSTIRKISTTAPYAVTTLAGTSGNRGELDGTGAAAQFNRPAGIVYDGSNYLYVCDNGGSTIRRITVATGVVVTLAGTANSAAELDGNGTAAKFNGPAGIAYDGSSFLYVTDNLANTIRKISTSSPYTVTTLVSSGSGLSGPWGVAIDASGNLEVADAGNNLVRTITTTGVVLTLAGDGTAGELDATGAFAEFVSPYSVVADNLGNLFVGDNQSASSTVRKILLTGWTIVPILNSNLVFNTSTGVITGTSIANFSPVNYTVRAFNASGSSSFVVTISCGHVIDWTGTTSSTWGTATNWSTGVTPVSTDDVQIGVITFNNQPTIDALTPANVVINSITFGAVKTPTLTITSPQTLAANNNITVNTGVTTTITGTGSVNMPPNSVVYVNGTGKLALTLSGSGQFTLKSDSTGDAAVGPITATSITGTVTVERYLRGGNVVYRGNRLLSSPVYNATDANGNHLYSINYLKNSMYLTATTTNGGFDNVSAANPTLYFYRENLIPNNSTFTGGNFRGVNNILSSPSYTMDVDGGPYTISEGNGYLCFFRGNRASASFATETTPGYVPQPVTLSTSGTLNAGQITVRDWFNPTSTVLSYSPSSPVGVMGYNLIGNPYASAIDWDTFQTTVGTSGIYGVNVSNAIYEYDPVTKTYGSYTANSGGVGSTSFATNVISSGQGFFIVANTAGAKLTINESAKTTKTNTGIKLLMGKPVNAVNNQYIRLQVMGKDSTISDQTLIRFNSQAKLTYTNNLDAPYKPGYGDVSLSSKSADLIDLSINTIPLPGQKREAIKINVNATNNGTYVMSLRDIVAIPQLFDIWLIDSYKKDSVNMRLNKTYRFDINTSNSASFGANRFTLAIGQNPNYAYHLLDFTASKVQAARQVEVVWKTQNEANYTNFTVERSVDNGKTFEVLGGIKAASQGTYSFLDKNPVSGQNLYRLKQEDLNNTISYSKLVLIQYADLGSTLVGNKLSIYPNPASSTINLAAAPQVTENATYSIKIMNSSGIVIKTITSSQPTWQGSVSNLRPGTYLIRMVNNKTQNLVGENKFVKL